MSVINSEKKNVPHGSAERVSMSFSIENSFGSMDLGLICDKMRFPIFKLVVFLKLLDGASNIIHRFGYIFVSPNTKKRLQDYPEILSRCNNYGAKNSKIFL